MNQALDISFYGLGSMFALIGIIAYIFHKLGLSVEKRLLTASLRMSVQLFLVGIYLRYLFHWNAFFLNTAWLFIMIVVANSSISKDIGLHRRPAFFLTISGTVISTLFVLLFFLATSIRPEPFYDARYLIPVGGMILGNCMRSNIIALKQFTYQLVANQKQYIQYLGMGASVHEACQPFYLSAIRQALTPIIATMSTMGIVSLPGMMTGQILGGSSPLIAIKYQIAIMLAIFSSAAIGILVNIYILIKFGFTKAGYLNPNLIPQS